LKGTRHSANLWHCDADSIRLWDSHNTRTSRNQSCSCTIMHKDTRRDEGYVRYTHTCLGNPVPTTFLQAVQRGYITGPNQFPRLTPKLVRRNMPNSEATAKGHLNKTPTGQPHVDSQSVDAQRRLHRSTQRTKPTKTEPFHLTCVPRSKTLHIDYTGSLSERCEMGTVYFLVAYHGSYIHVEPLTSLQGPKTATAITSTVDFFQKRDVQLDNIRIRQSIQP
jgi:hypothetical protein